MIDSKLREAERVATQVVEFAVDSASRRVRREIRAVFDRLHGVREKLIGALRG